MSFTTDPANGFKVSNDGLDRYFIPVGSSVAVLTQCVVVWVIYGDGSSTIEKWVPDHNEWEFESVLDKSLIAGIEALAEKGLALECMTFPYAGWSPEKLDALCAAP